MELRQAFVMRLVDANSEQGRCLRIRQCRETFLSRDSSGILGKTMAAHSGRFCVRGF